MSRVALIVGGVAAAGSGAAALFLSAKKTVEKVKAAVAGVAPPVTPGTGATNSITIRITGYWPFQEGLTAKERKMEGGHNDRIGKPLTTAEQHLSDPVRYPHVSLSGDPNIFPYGQKMLVPWGDRTLVGRVVDTGSHFTGVGKVFRVVGAEPIDVCVDSSKTVVPKRVVEARVVVGDDLAHMTKRSKPLALEKAGVPQTSLGELDGLDLLGVEEA